MVMEATRVVGSPDSGYPSQPDPNAIVMQVDNELIESMDIDIPLLTMVGGVSGEQVRQNKFFWPLGDNWTRRPTHGGLAAVDTATITITAQAYRYPIGTIFKLESELVRVTGIPDVNTLSITRGYAGTTPATHASTVEMIIAGSSMHEGDTWVYRPTPTVTLPFNYTQVDNAALRNTWSRRDSQFYGVDGNQELDKYTADTLRQKMVGIEQALISGRRFAGEASEPRTSGGMEYFITSANGADVTDKSSAALQLADFHGALDRAAIRIGVENLPDMFIMDSWAKQKVSSFFQGARRLTNTEKIGNSVIDNIETEWGVKKLLMHYSLPKGNIYGFKTSDIEVVHLGSSGMPHIGETQENTGPFQGRYYYSEIGFRIKHIERMIRIHNYSLTS